MKRFFFLLSRLRARVSGAQGITKAIFAAAVGCFMAATAHPQGAVNFSNNSDTLVRLAAADGSLQVITEANAFQVALYWAPDGVTDESAFMYTGRSVFVLADPFNGRFVGGTVEFSQVAPGSPVMLQVRGWETQYGNTYDEVMASGNPAAHAGKTDIFRLQTGHPLQPPPPLFVDGAFTGLILHPVPEPTTTVLVMAGAVLFGLKGGKRRRTSINGLFGRQKPKQTNAKFPFVSIWELTSAVGIGSMQA
jgi:hypothetical protein